MSRINQGNQVEGVYKIVDAASVARDFFVILVLGVIAYILGQEAYKTGKPFSFDNYPGSTICIILAFLFFLEFRANLKGYVGDVERGILEFPGGGLEPKSFFSYFSPFYWIQGFRRYELSIHEIRQLDKSSYTTRSKGSDGKTKTSTSYLLSLDGEFGAVVFSFSSKAKRDELYSLLVRTIQQYNGTLENDFG